jgi:DNA repair exonuclease SbcCD nuclease subunit
MKQKNYDYWALGHIHVPTVLSKTPPIIYPGTPQGHTQKEKETGVQLVTLDGLTAHYETKRVAAVTWEDYELSLSGIKSRKDALEAMKAFFQTSQRQLVKFSLKDTEHLPTDWLNNREKPELIAYLNEYLVQNDFEQIVYQLEVNAVPESEKLVLTGKEVMAQLLASYQTNEVFETIIEELATHPLIKRTISSQTLKEETLAQVKTTLEQEFCWSEEE